MVWKALAEQFSVLKNMVLGKILSDEYEFLLKNQESCIASSGTITKYFKLVKGTRQGDLILANLFVFVLRMVFFKN